LAVAAQVTPAGRRGAPEPDPRGLARCAETTRAPLP